MGFTNGGGFVQEQPQIVATDFTSSNFSNTAGTGFDLNSGNTTDAAGTPPNTIQVYSQLQVGPSNGNNLDLAYNNSAAAIAFHTGNPLDTNGAGVGAATFVQGGQTISGLDIQSATENGNVEIVLAPSPTVASGIPAQMVVSTTGETTPTGSLVKGLMIVGASATDTWTAEINNESSVINGSAVGEPALILGNVYTPQSRLLVSVDEILSITGGATPTSETLYLNTNNTQSVAGGVVNPWTRHVFARDTNAYTFAPGTSGTFTHPSGSTAAVNFSLPGSGIVTVHHKVVINAVGASGELFIDVVILNLTQSTTPYAGSQNNCSQVFTSFPLNCSVAGFITLGGGGQGGVMGNPGDTMQAIVSYQTSAATTWTVFKQQLTVAPSL